jgi:hypothetical protein
MNRKMERIPLTAEIAWQTAEIFISPSAAQHPPAYNRIPKPTMT